MEDEKKTPEEVNEEKPEKEETKEKKEPDKGEGKDSLTDKVRENPWIAATLVLGILALIILLGNFIGFTGGSITTFTGSITGGTIGVSDVGDMVLEIVNSQGGNAELVDVSKEHGLYKVTFSSEGRESSVYVTLDGKNIVNGLIPLSILKQDDSSQQEPDWSIFENELPESVKSKILSFTLEESEEYNDSMMVNEFKNYELVPKTLIVFYHSGCGWCTKYYPVLVDAMERYPEITIYALVLNDERDIAEKYGVTGTPASIINGKYFVSGYKSSEDLSKILDELN